VPGRSIAGVQGVEVRNRVDPSTTISPSMMNWPSFFSRALDAFPAEASCPD
jgi:hypothetical protein